MALVFSADGSTRFSLVVWHPVDYYHDDLVAIPSTKQLADIKSVDAIATEKGLPAHESDDDLNDMWGDSA